MINYVYKPKLARMIHIFMDEKLEIIKIKKSFNLLKYFNEGSVSGSNGYRWE